MRGKTKSRGVELAEAKGRRRLGRRDRNLLQSWRHAEEESWLREGMGGQGLNPHLHLPPEKGAEVGGEKARWEEYQESPERFFREVLGWEPWWKQVEVAEAVRDALLGWRRATADAGTALRAAYDHEAATPAGGARKDGGRHVRQGWVSNPPYHRHRPPA